MIQEVKLTYLDSHHGIPCKCKLDKQIALRKRGEGDRRDRERQEWEGIKGHTVMSRY